MSGRSVSRACAERDRRRRSCYSQCVDAGGNGVRSTVLVVEDDGSLRSLLAKQLDRMGFAVHEVEDGEQALAWLTSRESPGLPVLICLDLSLPAMSGFRVCEEIRLAPRTRTVPILVITARSSAQD